MVLTILENVDSSLFNSLSVWARLYGLAHGGSLPSKQCPPFIIDITLKDADERHNTE